MSLDGDGYMRPVPNGESSSTTRESFNSYCPGVSVTSPFSHRRAHPVVGPYVSLWRAHATNAETRTRGSSGGVLTALQQWAVSQGAVGTAVAPSPTDARRTVPVRITSREEALRSASSRYAPVAAASGATGLTHSDFTVGKPCEAAALRQIYSAADDAPLILSFFCMGTPSSHATDVLTEKLTDQAAGIESISYRGNGWPGRFTVTTAGGTDSSMSYEESWGHHLGPTVQWRCRTCLDGLGESADLVAGDLWNTDENGYPKFNEDEGHSVLVARTPRGHAAAVAAQTAGLLYLEPTDVDSILKSQPSQVHRKALGISRLAATRSMGLPITRFSGFRQIRRTRWNLALLWTEFLGTAGRLRARGHDWGLGPLRIAASVKRRMKTR
jgi:coenzyme F420 hydrogenase subunit beta